MKGGQEAEKLKMRGVFGETVLHACVLCMGTNLVYDKSKANRARQLAMHLIGHYGPGSCVGEAPYHYPCNYHPSPCTCPDLINCQFDTCHLSRTREDGSAFCTNPNCHLGQAQGPSVYEGETALHMAIVYKDIEMARALVHNGCP